VQPALLAHGQQYLGILVVPLFILIGLGVCLLAAAGIGWFISRTRSAPPSE
jgi:hypothetical protein